MHKLPVDPNRSSRVGTLRRRSPCVFRGGRLARPQSSPSHLPPPRRARQPCMRTAGPRRFRGGGTRSSGDAPWATVARSRLGVGEPLPRSQFSHRYSPVSQRGAGVHRRCSTCAGGDHGLPSVYLPLLLLRVRPPAARGGRTPAGQLPARRFERPCGPVHPRLELHGQRVPSRQALGADDQGIERPGARFVAGGGRGSRPTASGARRRRRSSRSGRRWRTRTSSRCDAWPARLGRGSPPRTCRGPRRLVSRCDRSSDAPTVFPVSRRSPAPT